MKLLSHCWVEEQGKTSFWWMRGCSSYVLLSFESSSPCLGRTLFSWLSRDRISFVFISPSVLPCNNTSSTRIPHFTIVWSYGLATFRLVLNGAMYFMDFVTKAILLSLTSDDHIWRYHLAYYEPKPFICSKYYAMVVPRVASWSILRKAWSMMPLCSMREAGHFKR